MDKFDKAIEMYRSGRAIANIRRELGIAPPQLYKALHKRGIPLRNPDRTDRRGNPRTEKKLQAAIDDYLAGKQMVEIFRRHKVSSARFYDELRLRNIEGRNEKSSDAFAKADDILKAHKAGSWPSKIAEELGLRTHFIRLFLEKNGIKAHRKPTQRSPKNMTRINIMAKLYNEGQGYKEIGDVFGVTRQAVQQALKGHILPRPRGKPTGVVNDKTKEIRRKFEKAVLQDHRNGMTKLDIAKKHGLTSYIVDRIFCENRVFPNPVDTFPEEQALRLRQVGLSYTQIAEALDSSAMTVHRHLLKYNEVKRNEIRLGEDIKQQVLADFNAGMNIKQIGHKYQLPKKMLGSLLAQACPADEIINDYKGGMTMDALAVKYRVSYYIVSRILRERAVSRRTRVRFPVEEAIALRKQQLSIDEIALRLGFTDQTVRRYVATIPKGEPCQNSAAS